MEAFVSTATYCPGRKPPRKGSLSARRTHTELGELPQKEDGYYILPVREPDRPRGARTVSMLSALNLAVGDSVIEVPISTERAQRYIR